MSLGRILLVLGRLLTVVVLVASAVYVFVYLVRWEWNRALVAGLFFLASEAVLLSSLILSRLHSLSDKVTTAQERSQAAALSARIRDNRPESAGPFAWLSPNRTNVMLPVLIGAGVVLSAVSYLVEQISRVTAVPAAEHELARGLARMALPAEGLRPTGRIPLARRAPRRFQPPSPRNRVWTWVALAGVAALAAMVVLAMIQSLRTVPAPSDPERRISMDLLVLDRDLQQSPEQIARALWATCAVRVPDDVRLTGVEALAADDQVRLHVAPAPGISDTRELIGCMQDAVIERARAYLLSVRQDPRTTPSAAPGPRA